MNMHPWVFILSNFHSTYVYGSLDDDDDTAGYDTVSQF